MDDIKQQDDHHHHHQQEKYRNTNDDNISSMIEQISEHLIHIRQDDLELAEKFKSIYNDLCLLRQSLTNPHLNSTADITTIQIRIDSPTSNRSPPKQRSDSEPNILSDRQRIITIIEDLQ